MPDGWMERRLSIETKQAFFWALLVARCANEPSVTRSRILAALLRTSSVADYGARVQIAPGDLMSFEECVRRITRDLAERGVELGSKEHIASVHPLPLEASVQDVLRVVFEQEDRARESVTPLELLLAMTRE